MLSDSGKIILLSRINPSLRSYIATFKQLMVAKPLIQKHPEYLDQHSIDWELVEYFYDVTQEFDPILTFTDSTSFSAGDTLASLMDLLSSLLDIRPAHRFRSIHEELLLTCCDYIFGQSITGRKLGKRGAGIKSRATPTALVGYFLGFFSRNFSFTGFRQQLKEAQEEEVITLDLSEKIITYLNSASSQWTEEIDKILPSFVGRFTPQIDGEAVSESPSEVPQQPRKRVKRRGSLFEKELKINCARRQAKQKKTIADEIHDWREFDSEDYAEWMATLSDENDTAHGVRNLKFFSDFASKFPKLKLMSDLINQIPGSSGAIERLFSKANDLMSSKRNKISTENVESSLMCSSYDHVKYFFE